MHKDINVNVSGPQQPTSQYKTVVLKGQDPFATQVTEPNTKYVIKHNFDLGGETITIPENCVLEFDGGGLYNGTIISNETILEGNKVGNAVYTGHYTDSSYSELRTEVDALNEAVGSGGTVDIRIEAAVAPKANSSDVYSKTETYSKSETYSKTELNNMITTPEVNYVNVEATDQTTDISDVLPATGAADTIYKIGSWDGSQYDASKYSEYTWNGSTYVYLATRDHGVDNKPTAGSDNLVKSGGVDKSINDVGICVSVEIDDLNIKDYNIKSNGTFGTSTSNKHACIAVNEGDIYYLKASRADTNIAFATSDDVTSGGQIPLVSGTNVITIPNTNEYYKVVIPADCYLLFSVFDGTQTSCYKSSKTTDLIQAFWNEHIINDIIPNSENAVKSAGIYNNIVSLAKQMSMLCENITTENTSGYWLNQNNVIVSVGPSSTTRRRLKRIPVNAGEVYFISTNTYGNSVPDYLFGDNNDGFISQKIGNTDESTAVFYIVEVPTGASFLYINDYITEGLVPYVRKAVSVVPETVERKRVDDILSNAVGKSFVPQGVNIGNGTYDGNIGSVATFSSSSSWTVSSMVIGETKVIKIKTTIYGSSHYGVVFVDENDIVLSNLYLRGSSSSENITNIIIVPEGAAKVYVNRRNGTYYPEICGLVDSSNVLGCNIIKVLTTNCGSFEYGDGETPLETYKQNWRRMLNDSEYDVWGIEDWAQYFDYGVETIDSQDAVVANTIDGTYPLVKSANDRTRVFYRGECKLESDADYTSSIHHVSKIVNGKTVHFYIVYFKSGEGSAADRQAEANRLISEISAAGYEYAVIMGDFNAWTASEYDVWKNAGYKVANCGYLGQINTLRDIPADNIIVLPSIDIIKTEILDEFALNTDHKPMKAVLKIK